MEQDVDQMKRKLAQLIVQELKNEFAIKHLSGNLVNTIKVTFANGNAYIEIPAQVYNMALYKRTGTIQYKNGNKSYASRLNDYGSKYGNHVGYVDNCINIAIQKWISHYGIKTRVKQ